MSRRKRERNRISKDNDAVNGLGLSGVSADRVVKSRRLSASKGMLQRAAEQVKAHWVISVIVALAIFTTTALALKYLDEDAKRKRAAGVNASEDLTSWMDTVNPFTTAPLPNPTPQLSKEYIYAGSRLLVVEDANANAAPPADLAIWRPSTGTWWVMGGQGYLWPRVVY